MAIDPSPVVDDVLTVLRAFIAQIVPAGIEIVVGLGNRVPEPTGDYVLMTPTTLTRLATTVDDWDNSTPNPTAMTHQQSVQMGVQLDFYGEASFDWAAAFSTLFRDDYGCEALAPTCAPLHADEARQMPLITGEKQYLPRAMVTAYLQYNPTVSTAQEFADTLSVGLINVDVTYPVEG